MRKVYIIADYKNKSVQQWDHHLNFHPQHSTFACKTR